jgi:hypothetical protein
MTINHKPATPLPWNKRTNVSSNPDLPARMQDEKYRLHAANAYPLLVEMVATYADDPDSPAAKLLRELGEE